ncbi:MAG TPA: hypothetical protein DEG44_02265, partial [Candidatus Kerfeldbacteria bacterium]|nr:hypothetical protein [Candidatus Kerfeldbacteria bacterium]
EAKLEAAKLKDALVTVHNNTYQLKRFIGRGNFGIAYLAEQLGTGKQYVIKLSKPYDHKLMRQPAQPTIEQKRAGNTARYAVSEIAVLHRLTHDEQNQPLERHDGEPPFPIMYEAQLMQDPLADRSTVDMRMAAEVIEYIDGPNLQRVLREEGPMRDDLPRLKKIVLGFIHAIRRMHDKGVLHLDVKISNAVIDDDDNVIVLDYGASQIPEKWASRRAKPIVWADPLMPVYSKRYTTRTDVDNIPSPARDVYALGVSLQELVYGLSDVENIMEIQAGFSRELRVLDATIATMVNPDPDQRPTLAEVEQHLKTSWQELEDQAALAAVKQLIAS